MSELPMVDGIQLTETITPGAVGSDEEGYTRVVVRIGDYRHVTLVTQELVDDEVAFAVARQKNRLDAIAEYRRSMNQGEGI